MIVFGQLFVPELKVAYIDDERNIESTKNFFKNAPRKAKQQLIVYQLGVSVMKNNFLFQVTDGTMNALVENGIPQHFLDYIVKVILRAIPPEPNAPKRFSFGDLEFGFVIFLVCCKVSIFAFTAEIVIFYLKEFCGLIGFLIFFN